MPSNGKTVRLDNDTLDALATERVGFETPNDCIKRVLERNCQKPFKNRNKPNEVDEDDEF